MEIGHTSIRSRNQISGIWDPVSSKHGRLERLPGPDCFIRPRRYHSICIQAKYYCFQTLGCTVEELWEHLSRADPPVALNDQTKDFLWSQITQCLSVVSFYQLDDPKLDKYPVTKIQVMLAFSPFLTHFRSHFFRFQASVPKNGISLLPLPLSLLSVTKKTLEAHVLVSTLGKTLRLRSRTSIEMNENYQTF